MYARVIPLQLKPNYMDDFLTVYQKSAVPDLLQRRGFGGALVLTDVESQRGLLLSLWEQPDDLRRSQPHSQRIVSAMLLPFLAQPPTPAHYEVCVYAGQYIGGRAARTLSLPIAGEKLDGALAVYSESLLPELKQQAGFQGVFWFADRRAGSGLGLTLWTSPEAMRAADGPGAFFPRAAQTLAAFFQAPPVRGYYTVSSQL
jgi:hypothetical protein